MFRCALMIAAIALSPMTAVAQERTVRATNGVEVRVEKDAFAGSVTVMSPLITQDGAAVLVGKQFDKGEAQPTIIQGSTVYSGDWRNYTSAILRGGHEVTFETIARDVGRCRGSRYGGSCTLSEDFMMHVSAEQIASYADGADISIQVRAERGEPILFVLPVAHFEAVEEVFAAETGATSAEQTTPDAP